MKEQTKRAIVFGMVLILAFPAIQVAVEGDALAGPFDTLSGSRNSGKRTHKQKSKKDEKVSRKKSSNSSNSSSRTTSRPATRTTSRSAPATSRSTTTRRVDDRRTVRCTSSGRCDGPVTNSAPRTTTRTTTSRSAPSARRTTTRTTTTRNAPVRRTTTRTTTVQRRPVHHRTTYRNTSRTEVHHYHHGNARRQTNTRYYGRRTGGTVNSSAPRESSGSSAFRNPREIYITGGMGLSGLAANQISDAPLPGLDFNLGVGAKRGLIVGELGFGLGGYRLDPAMAVNTADMTLVSVTGDIKLQPTLAFIEPYISAGIGGHAFNDHIIDEGAAGASLRLGAGVDLRFDNVAVSAQYQRNFMALVGDSQIYEDGSMGASTETIGLGLKIYF